jgi:FdhD protein
VSAQQPGSVAGTRAIERRLLADSPSRPSADTVIEEIPVALVYNGISHAVMMVTPVHLEDFALGFSLSEGILSDPAQLLDLEVVGGEGGLEVQLTILGEQFAALKGRRRQLAGRSGCGLCGKESLQQALLPLPVLECGELPDRASIVRAVNSLRGHQPIQLLTGASHAAAWCDAGGRVELLREDVGRHNALDKLIGARHRRQRQAAEGPGTTGFALITSRASYEMVAKAAMAGMGTLVALSAPTSLAIEAAERCNISLVGFAAGEAPVIYHSAAG